MRPPFRPTRLSDAATSLTLRALLVFVGLGAIAPTTLAADLVPTAEQSDASRALANRLPRAHYLGLELDDELSAALFDRYVEFLDPRRELLLATDVDEFESLRERMDDALLAGDLEPAFDMFNRCHARRLARIDQALELLGGDLDALTFGPEATLEVDRSEAPWPADEAALDELWRKRLAAQLLDQRLAGRDDEEARDILVRRFEDQQRRVNQTKAADVFLLFMNALTSSYDPHTSYLAPQLAENFDMRLSLSLEGIGALLRPDGEYARIERLIAGGAAEKAGELMPGDRVVGVAQGVEGDMVDVVGWRLDDVVSLIRGARGTVVRLAVLGADAPESAPPRTLSITRERVKLEEQAATSEVVEMETEDGGSLKLGVVELPAFYTKLDSADGSGRAGKSSTSDVEDLLVGLSEQDVDGVLLDLRGNGGGSLVEAYELSGLVLGKKAVVQVRNARGEVQSLRSDRPAVYDGPLVVLVDRLSASASEIFAAAVQDHGRGIVVGERTFGKGTVQTAVPAADGRLVVTVAKFYRVTGQTTQHEGVVPDIVFPPVFDPEEIGESALDDALVSDRIRGLRIRPDKLVKGLRSELLRDHEVRVAGDPDFRRMERELELVREARSENELSLDLETRRAEQEDYDRRREEILDAWRAERGEVGRPVDEPEDDDVFADGDASEDADAADDGEVPPRRTPRIDAPRQEALNILADLVAGLRRA